MGGSYQQEVDLQALYKDVASDYLVEVNVAEQLPNALDRAIRTAPHRRAPTALIMPSDLQEQPYSAPSHAFKQVPSSEPAHAVRAGSRRGRSRGPPGILNAGSKVAILIGQGARGAAREVVAGRRSDRRRSGQSVAGQGCSARRSALCHRFDRSAGHPAELRVDAGLRHPAHRRIQLPYSQFLPDYGRRARSRSTSTAARSECATRPSSTSSPTPQRPWITAPAAAPQGGPRLARHRGEKRRPLVGNHRAPGMLSAKPVNPMRVAWELSERLPDNAIVTADSGSSTNWYARCVRLRAGMRASLSGTLATMGPAVPYAIGAKFAHPDRPVIAIVGDGAMQMNGLAELLTVKRYPHQWSDPRLVVCVFHNNDLNQVTWELRAMGGAPKFEESQSLPDVSYAEVARAMGLRCDLGRHPTMPSPAPGTRRWRADRPILLDIALRSRSAADPAARHLRAAQGPDLGRTQGRPQRVASDGSGRENQDAGIHPDDRLELMSEQLIVVGSGPGGVGAAESFRQHDAATPVRIFTSDTAPPYARPPLSKEFLRGETDGRLPSSDAVVHRAAHRCRARPRGAHRSRGPVRRRRRPAPSVFCADPGDADRRPPRFRYRAASAPTCCAR